jgi:pre-mRNA-processing factor 17
MDNSVQVYGAKDKFNLNRKKRFTGHLSAGYAAQVSFSPDGHFLLSGDGEGRAFVWDWRSSKVLRKWKCHDQVRRSMRTLYCYFSLQMYVPAV